MARHVIDVSADSTASLGAVWRLLSDVTTWPEWSGFSEAGYVSNGSPEPHGVGAVRRLRVGRLRSIERVLVFDPPTRFSYDYEGSLPIEGYRGDVTLSGAGDGTHITWHGEFNPRFALTGRLPAATLRLVLRSTAKKLARAAEVAARPDGPRHT